MQAFNRTITILSLILLCSSTDVVSKISKSEPLAITKLPNHIVHILIKYLDIPTGFTLILQQRSWYAQHYATLYDRQSLHYASEYFPFLTTFQNLIEDDGHDFKTYSIHDPVTHLSDLPKLHYYSNFFRTVPNPAVFYSGMQILFLNNSKPVDVPWALCTAPEEDREKNNASMESWFHSYWCSCEYSHDTDQSSAHFDTDSKKCLRMVYNPLTTELRQFTVEKAKCGRILMSRFLRIPAFLVFTHRKKQNYFFSFFTQSTELENPAIHLELLCRWGCVHWWANDKYMYIYWRNNSRSPGLDMRFNLNGILCEIRVDIPYGNGNKHDSRRFSIQNTKTSTFVGQSIRYEANDFNTIHAFYYPSYRIPWLYWVPVSCRKNIDFNCFF